MTLPFMTWLAALTPRSSGQRPAETTDHPDFDEMEITDMTDKSDFLIPAAILTAAVIEKSDREKEELAKYALHLHNTFVENMHAAAKKWETER
jgi:hypothetical protein